MNIGERNELIIKLKLIQLRDKQASINVRGSNYLINSVGFDGVEYPSTPDNISLSSISDSQLKQLTGELSISNSTVFNKADVYINGIGFSIKSLSSAPPALVNHTARPSWERVCSSIGKSILPLDRLIEEYWDLRESMIIREDVNSSDPNSPFKDHKNYLSPILNYFLFKGSGSRDSKHPAEYIIDFIDPLDCETWNIWGDDYLDEHWGRLVFSLRSKKGMSNYPDIKNSEKKKSMAKWTRYFQDAYRGALHVRVR